MCRAKNFSSVQHIRLHLLSRHNESRHCVNTTIEPPRCQHVLSIDRPHTGFPRLTLVNELRVFLLFFLSSFSFLLIFILLSNTSTTLYLNNLYQNNDFNFNCYRGTDRFFISFPPSVSSFFYFLFDRTPYHLPYHYHSIKLNTQVEERCTVPPSHGCAPAPRLSSFHAFSPVVFAAALTPVNGYVRPVASPPTDGGKSSKTLLEVKLAYGATKLEGFLNVRPVNTPASSWGSACSYGFKDNSAGANVVCSQLGYGRSALTNFVGLGPAFPTATPVWLDSVNCTVEGLRNGPVEAYAPAESRLNLSQCVYRLTEPGGINPCYHNRDVGVRCVPPPSLWEFKLVNSTAAQPTRGLVMMRPSVLLGEDVLPWGTVDRTHFVSSMPARRALCGSLGFKSVLNPLVLDVGAHGSAKPSLAPSYLTMQSCPSDATVLDNCTLYSFSATSWTESSQLAIQCDDDVESAHYPIAYKFVNGWSTSSGQLYVRTRASAGWLYVPARILLDGPPPYNANVTQPQNVNALRAICIAAGFPNATSPAFRFVGRTLDDTSAARVSFQRIVCIENPSNLTRDCRFSRSDVDMTTGDNSLPSGIDCFADDYGSRERRWEFRLMGATKFNGTTPINGIVQMRIGPDTPWGTVANSLSNNYGFYEAVCGSMGFDLDMSIVLGHRRLNEYTSNAYLYNSYANLWPPIYLENVSCPHTVYVFNTTNNRRPRLTSLQDNCTYSPVGSSLSPTRDLLAVDCDTSSASPAASRGGVRDVTKLRVSMNSYGPTYLYGSSGGNYNFLCTNDTNTLALVCQLGGYTWANVSTLSYRGIANFGTAYAWANMRCPPGVTSFENCWHEHPEADQPCVAQQVHCFLEDLPTSLYEWRLVNGSVPSAGRLEFRPYPGQPWGSVRNNGWASATTQYMLAMVCSFMGYNDPRRPRYRFTKVYGEGPGMVWFSAVSCASGLTRENFLSCLRSYVGTNQQSHNADLGIECEGPIVPSTETFEYRAVLVANTTANTYYRIEVREGEGYEWGRIHQSSSTTITLDTACQTVGLFSLDNNKPRLFSSTTTYKNRSIPSKLYNHICAERARSLRDCPFDPSSYINSDYDDLYGDFIVDCNPKYTDTNQYRLFGGPQPSIGRLEVRRGGVGPFMAMSDSFTVAFYRTYLNYMSTRGAICRTVGYPYHYNLTNYGYLHYPPQLLPPSSFGSPTNVSEQMPMDYLFCSSGGYGERLGQCSMWFSSTQSAYNASNVISIDCEPRLYDIKKVEWRLNISDAAGYRFKRVEMRLSPEMQWGTIYVNSVNSLPQHVMRSMCRTITGGLGPANFAEQYMQYGGTIRDRNNANGLLIHVLNFNCPENSTYLHECSSGVLPNDVVYIGTYTDHYYDLLLDCNAVPPADLNFRWNYRLTQNNVDTTALGVGVLEIKPYEGVEWGTVCSDGWQAFSTVAACRGVGFDTRALPDDKVSALQQRVAANPYGVSNPIYKNMTVWFSYVYCLGETKQVERLEECRKWFTTFPSTTTSCKAHNNDVALSCRQYIYDIPAFEYRVPLVYANVPSIVRLEVRPNSTEKWGTVYQPEVRSGEVNANTKAIAQAVCLMAGYTREHAALIPVNVAVAGPVWLAYLNCTNPATGLPATHARECTFDKSYFGFYTVHTYDLTVDCLYVPTDVSITNLSTIEFRLNENTGHVSKGRGFGRVEARPRPYAEWGTVSSDGFTNELASAMCRTMGYASPDPIDAQFATGQSPQAIGRQWFSIPAGGCPPKPNNLGECWSAQWTTSGNMFSHSNDLWLECYPLVTFRLSYGVTKPSISQHGLLEIRIGSFTNSWGTVCSDVFDRSPDAWRVLCLEMGWSEGVRAAYSQDYGINMVSSTAYAKLDDLRCPPGSKNLAECSYRQLGLSKCQRYEAASLNCFIPTYTRVYETRTLTDTRTGQLTRTVAQPRTRTASSTLAMTATVSVPLTPSNSLVDTRSKTSSRTMTSTNTTAITGSLTHDTSPTASIHASPTSSQTQSGATQSVNKTTSLTVSSSFTSSNTNGTIPLTQTLTNTVSTSNTAATPTPLTTRSTSLPISHSWTVNQTISALHVNSTVTSEPSLTLEILPTRSQTRTRNRRGRGPFGSSQSATFGENTSETETYRMTSSATLKSTPSTSLCGGAQCSPTASLNPSATSSEASSLSRSRLPSRSVGSSSTSVTVSAASRTRLLSLSEASASLSTTSVASRSKLPSRSAASPSSTVTVSAASRTRLLSLSEASASTTTTLSAASRSGLLSRSAASSSPTVTESAASRTHISSRSVASPSTTLTESAAPSSTLGKNESTRSPATTLSRASPSLSPSRSSSHDPESPSLTLTPTAAHSPTLQTMYPEPSIGNAAGEDGDGNLTISIFEAAMRAGNVGRVQLGTQHASSCERLGRIFGSEAVLTPILFRHSLRSDKHPADETEWLHVGLSQTSVFFVYDAALLYCALFVAAVAITGVATVAVVALGSLLRREDRGTGIRARLLASAERARFPATLLQSLIHASHGAAVSAGVAFGSAKGHEGLPVVSIVAVPLLLVAWVGVCALVERAVPSRERRIEVWGQQREKSGRGEGTRYADAEASRQECSDEDRARPLPSTPPGLLLLRCGAVRPRAASDLFGPVVGDLRFHQRPYVSSVVPFAVPFLLLVGSVVAGAANSCATLPYYAGGVYLTYALVTAVCRPFLSVSHNAVEVCGALAAGVVLVLLGHALDNASDVGEGGASPPLSATALVLCLAALSNARYPFIVARLLGVGVPCVVSVSAAESGEDCGSVEPKLAEAPKVDHDVLQSAPGGDEEEIFSGVLARADDENIVDDEGCVRLDLSSSSVVIDEAESAEDGTINESFGVAMLMERERSFEESRSDDDDDETFYKVDERDATESVAFTSTIASIDEDVSRGRPPLDANTTNNRASSSSLSATSSLLSEEDEDESDTASSIYLPSLAYATCTSEEELYL